MFFFVCHLLMSIMNKNILDIDNFFNFFKHVDKCTIIVIVKCQPLGEYYQQKLNFLIILIVTIYFIFILYVLRLYHYTDCLKFWYEYRTNYIDIEHFVSQN